VRATPDPRSGGRTAPLLLVTLLFPLGAEAADWPQYRGPARDGVSEETGLLASWPAGGPPSVWRVGIGAGFSGMSVVGGRLFTQYTIGEDDVLAAHDVANGQRLWTVRLDRRYSDGQGDGPRSTPTVDGDLVYGLSPRGHLVAAEVATGKVVWRKDLAAEFGADPPQWGISTQPAVEGDLLVVDVGGRTDYGVVAFDKRTGAVRWHSESGLAGYSQPIRLQVDGVDQLVVFRGTQLVALDPQSGRPLWRRPWGTDWDVNAASPIFVPPNRLFVSSGYDTGSALLKMQANGGKVTVAEGWASKGLKNQFSSSVVRGGIIYGFDNKVLKAVDLNTGADRWKQSGLGHGSLLLAEGKLWVLSDRGKLVLVEATPERYVELATAQPLSGKSWTAPTLANGKLYLRNEKEMLCLDVRNP
jgi:outer membrane protein assembly factor BamB